MIFKNRREAGKKLAEELAAYRGAKDTIIIGLPRGGVPVAYEVADFLNLPLDIVAPRKIGAPSNREFAIGAITETGVGIFDNETISRLGISAEYIDHEVARERLEAQNRLKMYRRNSSKRDLNGKTVIIIDDGLATGSTMKAAILSIKSEKAVKIIVAVPVSPPDTLQEIKREVDEVICLDAPLFFQAVGQFYAIFDQTPDEEVIRLIQKANG